MGNRRDFIKKSVIGTAGITIGGLGFTSKSYASIIGANDRINVAVIGIRSRGKSHIDEWCALKDNQNVRLITLCDTDEQFFPERVQTVLDKTGFKPGTEWDMHKVLNNPDIHAVSFATPNHWHALGTIWACQAGKHVYVEKPVSHNIFEGRKMVEAATKYNVRVQAGFQGRSYKNILQAIRFLHEGGIGEVYMARGLCFKPRDSFGIAKDSTLLLVFIMIGGLALLPGESTMKRKVTTIGIGIGIRVTETAGTRECMNTISHDGDLIRMNILFRFILQVESTELSRKNVLSKLQILKLQCLNMQMARCWNLKPGAAMLIQKQEWESG